MKVLKFGGTSVANAESIRKVIDIAINSSKKESIIVVVSALGGSTDVLLESGRKAERKDTSYITDIKRLIPNRATQRYNSSCDTDQCNRFTFSYGKLSDGC